MCCNRYLINYTTQRNEYPFPSFKKTGESRKSECAEFKSELESFVPPNIFKGTEIKDLCTIKIFVIDNVKN
jgi:hypothetical protein